MSSKPLILATTVIGALTLACADPAAAVDDSGGGDNGDAGSGNACGPWAAIEEGRTWRWERPDDDTYGHEELEVAKFDGDYGTLIETSVYDIDDPIETVYVRTQEFYCDRGLYISSESVEYDKGEFNCEGECDRDDPKYWDPVHGSYTLEATEPYLIYPKSLDIGDTWTSIQEYRYTGDDGETGHWSSSTEWSVVGKADLDVAGGSFSTLKVTGDELWENEHYAYHMWLSEDVGLIQTDSFELSEFHE